MTRYMVHACPAREWYVRGYLVPSMLEQGIHPSQITIWLDREQKGNLASFVESCRSLAGVPGGTWHLQDDVCICSDFAQRTKIDKTLVIAGFCYNGYEADDPPVTGAVMPCRLWHSCFQCVYIPNFLAAEFADWMRDTAPAVPEYAEMIATGKMDDTLFHCFLCDQHPTGVCLNLAPHLVEHVDYLVGGSQINQWRGHTSRGYYFEDDGAVDALLQKLARQRA